MSRKRTGPCPWCKEPLVGTGGLCKSCYNEYQRGEYQKRRDAVKELQESQLKVQELLTIQRCLQEKIRRLEDQIRVVGARTWAK